MKGLKLAIIRTHYEPLKIGAYNVQEIGLARELEKKGVETHIYSRFTVGNREGEELKISPLITIRSLKGLRLGRELFFKPGDGQIRFEEYDWVQVQEYANLMSRLLIRKAKSKNCRILINQGIYEDYKGVKRIYNIVLDRILLAYVIKNADRIFAKTSRAKEYLNSKGFPTVEIVPVGIDTSHFEGAHASIEPEFEVFRKKYSKIVLYIGQIERRRNPAFVIEIIEKYSAEDPERGFIIIGSGERSDWFDREVIKRGLADRVYRRKSVPSSEVSKYYQQSEVFILPTNYEIFGMVVLEALYFGIPVVSTETAGPQFILTGHPSLGKCLPLDLGQWIAFIKNLPDTDKLQNGAFRNSYILNNFSWKNSSVHYESLDR